MADIKRYVRLIFDRLSAKKVESEMGQSLADAGKKSGDNFLRELRAVFNRRLTDLKTQLATGLIDQREFKKQADLAARAFNTGIVKGMDEARKAGKLTEAEYNKLGRTLKRVGDEGASAWDRIKKSITTAGAALVAAFGISRLASFARDSIKFATEIQASGLRLRGVWEANAGAVGRTFEQIQNFTRELRDTTLFARDEIELATAQLLSYKSISGDTFERTLRLATNLSSVFGGLTQSTQALAKALDDPIRGLGDLRKQGFTFTDQVVEQIKALTQQNRLFEAQTIILRELESETGDVARQMATGWVGAVDRFGKSWEDLREALGNALIEAGNGPSVMDRMTRGIRYLTEHISDLIRLLGNLAKAILWVAGAAVLGKFVLAVRAATISVTGFIATLRALAPLLGVKGLVVAGVLVLTTVFQKLGGAARQAAADAKQAFEDFKTAASEANDFNLSLMESSLDAMDAAIRARLAQLRHGGAEVREEQKRLIGELNAIQQRMAVLRAERSGRNQRPGGGGGAAGDPGTPEGAKALGNELDRINRELAVREVMREQEATEARAKELQRREEMMTGHVRRIVATVEEGWRKLDQLDLLAKAGLDRPMTPKVRTTPPEIPIEGFTGVVEVAEQQASEFTAAWSGALGQLAQEVEDNAELFGDLAYAWASGGMKGLAQFAGHKVKENFAAAIENLARAFGSFGLGNPVGAKAHLTAAAKHGAAAAAWKLLAKGGGGGAAGGAGAASAAGSPDNNAGTRSDPRQDVTLIFTGKGWPAHDVDFQRSVFAGQQLARERYGENVNIRTIQR